MLDFGLWGLVCVGGQQKPTTPEIEHDLEGCGVAGVKIGSRGVGEVPLTRGGFVIFVASGGDGFSVVEELVYKIYVKY